jgi:hypothetical protein
MRKIVYLSPAKEEMIEAAEYYERQSPDLGRDFLSEVRRTLKKNQRKSFCMAED